MRFAGVLVAVFGPRISTGDRGDRSNRAIASRSWPVCQAIIGKMVALEGLMLNGFKVERNRNRAIIGRGRDGGFRVCMWPQISATIWPISPAGRHQKSWEDSWQRDLREVAAN
uniref:Putative secreted protein n=1 Tax=Anopheles darlingi TaxID=43151 RepID=A0A2M4DRR9_ANODA